MFEYIIRRLLLMIPTFFGTTLLVFMILQSVPSGPFEQAVLQIKMAKMQSGENQAASTSDDKGGMELSEEVLDKLRMQYGLDKSVWTRYFIWLGIAKKEIKYKEAELGVPFRETIQELGQGKYVPVSLQRWILAYEEDNGEIIILSSSVGTDFKWKDNTKGEYESVLVEFGDELLKFKKDFMCNYDLWYKEPMKLNIARNNSKATITKFKPKPFTPEKGK